MLYSNCDNLDNFDIQVIIDSDQIELYLEVIKEYPVILSIIEHQDYSWSNLINAHHKLMKTNKYYFTIPIPDDTTGICKHWDKAIVAKKGCFKDDLIVLYTISDWNNRDLKSHENCYATSDILKKNEHTPIWTYKFGEYLYPICDKFKIPFCRELIISFMVKCMYLKGINRHEKCDFYIKSFTDSNKMGTHGNEFWKKYSDDVYAEIEKAVEKMKCLQ